MLAEKCRRPSLYTRSKSACRNSRALRGKAPVPILDWRITDSRINVQITGTSADARTLPPAPLDYSRNPGFTETRLRPLARRREITFLPPWVFMRLRNP